ncbi:MAG: hypothetical protein EHM20_00120 [Alphaproteobacteria bacterium]|nr:MAG: hypothetical protein EHM20_00120 [Alphaproteobacteria bacterium]
MEISCKSIELKIDEEFKKLIPPLTAEEKTQLENNILDNGLLAPILLWNGIIIDGHNRYEILQKNSIELTEKDIFDMKDILKDREAVVEWILKNQMGRRNLNNDQMAIIRGKLYLLYKRQGRRTDLENETSNQTEGKSETKKEKQETAVKIGEQFGVSKATIERNAKFVKEAPPEIIQKVQDGELSMLKAKNEIRTQKQNEKIEEAQKIDLPSDIKILAGDVMEQLTTIENESIDMLLTDPPYYILGDQEWDQFVDKQSYFRFISSWLELVTKKIKRTGRIYISFAHDYMFDIYQIFKENNFYGFTFGNVLIWNMKNNVKPFDKKRYRISYEPIFYLYGPEASEMNFDDNPKVLPFGVHDIAVPQSNFEEGKFHPCQKPLELYRRLIQSGSESGDLIIDCFAGSGTTGVACKELNRSAILIEKSEDYIKIAKGRINSVI